MSGIVKAVFKPIKKVWKGIKKVASKVWDKIKKPVMAAAAIYLTAGIGASFATGSLASGFGSVNSAIGGFMGNVSGGAGGAAGGAAEGSASLAGAGQGASAATELGTLSSAGSSSLTTAGGTTISGAAGGGTAAGSVAGGASAAAQGLSTSGGINAAGTELLAQEVGVQASSPGFFGGMGDAASNAMSGNWSKAASDAGGALMDGASSAWNGATGSTGKALLTSNILKGYGDYQSQKDAEERRDRLRNEMTYWGMDRAGNTADDNSFLDMPQSRQMAEYNSLDDLIKRSRRG